jgi:LuxR family maltose regulon positive regulatory protein
LAAAEEHFATVVLVEVLSLLAMLRAAENDEPAAMALLEKALALAQSGGFMRLFVDLGPPMARVLQTLHGQSVSPNHISQILVAFPKPAIDQERLAASSSQRLPSALAESLTPRELEVLELLAQRLTNKEIAAELIVSLGTVKTHTLSIYAKLDVHGRRQAVNKARELNLLSPS